MLSLFHGAPSSALDNLWRSSLNTQPSCFPCHSHLVFLCCLLCFGLLEISCTPQKVTTTLPPPLTRHQHPLLVRWILFPHGKQFSWSAQCQIRSISAHPCHLRTVGNSWRLFLWRLSHLPHPLPPLGIFCFCWTSSSSLTHPSSPFRDYLHLL